MERDFKGVWIPAEVWLDDNLTTKEKFYLAVYNECSSHVTATELLSPLFSRQTANRILNALIFKGYLKRDHAASPEAAKDYVLKHKNEGELCEWCGTPNIVLH